MAIPTTDIMPVQPGAYKLPDAAKYCGGLNPETLKRAVKRGLLRRCRGVRHLVFTKAALDEFLNQ